MDRKSLFIFDLDGTLVDAYKAVWKSLNFALKKLGLPTVTLEKVKKNVGRGDRLFVETFFPHGESGKALKLYRAHHKKALLSFSKLKPGARRLIDLLRKEGRRTALASNRPQMFTNIVLKRLGLKLDYVLCADRIGKRKPDPKILLEILKKFRVRRKAAVYIGDMDIDMETARRAGIDAVFVTGGSSTLKSVRKYRKKVVRSLTELVKLYH
ncbi:MAG: HAD family hydrolase [Candidatus Omnitrophica bacterium]|nr:HAD family hydrolase [Candidatus Omnitrophota bacterium]